LAGDQVPGPYATTVLDDADGRVSDAVAEFVALAPNDSRAVAMRDELMPLLDEAARRLGDVRAADSADDLTALRASLPPLRPLAEKLAQFADRYR
jgi:hypothetical protein